MTKEMEPDDDRLERQQAALDALARLDELSRDLPPFDAVKLVREGREELERRSDFLFEHLKKDEKDDQ